MRKLVSLLALTPFAAQAQVPTPAAPQAAPIVLVGGTLHTGTGQVIDNAAVAFDKGRLVYAGPRSGFTQTGYQSRDISGQHVYPGLILPNTTLGLSEIEAIRATVDDREVGDLNPNVRALIAFNTDSEVLPTVRLNGVLLAQPTPRGGLVTGQSAIVQLDAWNWQDAVVKADDGIHLTWPEMVIRTNPAEDAAQLTRRQEARTSRLRDLEQLLGEGAAYRQAPTGRRENLRLTALSGLFDGSKTLYIHADYAKELIESVRLAKRLGVKNVALVGARDAWMVLDFLKQNDVAVVLSRTQALPRRDGDDYDQPYKLPAQLQAAGVRYCLDFQGDMETSRGRNLPFVAGQAVAFGLTKEQALTAITLSPARIMGIDKDYGSLETGKSATLVVSKGDLLDMRTNAVTLAYIDGRSITLESKQTALDKKFRAKYGLE